jgi:phosphotransacetylase
VALVDTASPEESVTAAVRLVKDGKATCLQKGKIPTDVLMRGLLSRKNGIRTGEVLSHIIYLMSDRLDHPLLISDAGVIPRPDIEEKKLLIKRATTVARSLGIASPKVALLSASEKVSQNIASSVEADALTRWWVDTGEHGEVFGPLSLDLALSSDAAAKKGITNPVVGCANILIAPEIETANAVYKSLTLFAGVIGAGIVLGAAVPILLTSRADPPLSRVASVLLAKCILSSSDDELSASSRVIACSD